MKSLCLILCAWIYSSVSWFTIYGNLKRICILLLCKNCINLNNVELVHSAFHIYYILLLCLSILLIFESLILKVKVAQSCPTLCDSQGLYTVLGILQARILEQVAFPFSRGSSQPRNQTGLLHCRQILYQLSCQGSPTPTKNLNLSTSKNNCNIQCNYI